MEGRAELSVGYCSEDEVAKDDVKQEAEESGEEEGEESLAAFGVLSHSYLCFLHLVNLPA